MKLFTEDHCRELDLSCQTRIHLLSGFVSIKRLKNIIIIIAKTAHLIVASDFYIEARIRAWLILLRTGALGRY